jgi:hypothetical protein
MLSDNHCLNGLAKCRGVAIWGSPKCRVPYIRCSIIVIAAVLYVTGHRVVPFQMCSSHHHHVTH